MNTQHDRRRKAVLQVESLDERVVPSTFHFGFAGMGRFRAALAAQTHAAASTGFSFSPSARFARAASVGFGSQQVQSMPVFGGTFFHLPDNLSRIVNEQGPATPIWAITY